MIKVTDDTALTVSISPSILRALVRATRDDEAGDQAVDDLAHFLRHYDGADWERAESLADEFGEFAYERGDTRASREEQHKIDAECWSENQRAFIEEAREKGHTVRLYSGRGMAGQHCPAVSGCVGADDFAASLREDALGMGRVVYAQD